MVDIEAGFLAKYPQYRQWLDVDRVRQDMRDTLARATLATDPFPHLVVDDFFPRELYAMLNDAWPPLAAFRPNKSRQKLDVVPRDDPRDEMTGRFSELPACLRELWDAVAHSINRHVVGPWLADMFRDFVRERVALLDELRADGRTGFSFPSPSRPLTTTGRLMMRGRGYVLRPHLDPAPHLVTALHYYADVADAGQYGTALFRAARPMPLDAFVRDGTTEYFHTQGIDVERVAQIEFVPNRFLAFPNVLHAAHGVTAPAGDHYRRVFQFHVTVRPDTAAAY